MMRKSPSADSSVGESGRLNVKSVPTDRETDLASPVAHRLLVVLPSLQCSTEAGNAALVLPRLSSTCCECEETNRRERNDYLPPHTAESTMFRCFWVPVQLNNAACVCRASDTDPPHPHQPTQKGGKGHVNLQMLVSSSGR